MNVIDAVHVPLSSDAARRYALDCVAAAPLGYTVTIEPERMSAGQKQRFHAICGDIARSSQTWAGRRRSLDEWKVLLISGHAMATHSEVEIVQGLEGELVNVRESIATMGRRRGASLIDYATAFARMNGVLLRDPRIPPDQRDYRFTTRPQTAANTGASAT